MFHDVAAMAEEERGDGMDDARALRAAQCQDEPSRHCGLPQHSMTLTARPPRAVSLYLSFMSAPVSRIVLMALSRETNCSPSPRTAIRAAVMALIDPTALRSMHGICTSPPIGSHVNPRLCSMPISAAFSTWSGVPPRTSASPAAAMEQADPIPAAPFVGAVPTRPPAAFSSFTASA